MAICNEMKPDETYVCETCGLELKVVRACDSGEDYDGGSGTCACAEPVTCCGQPLTRKVQAASATAA